MIKLHLSGNGDIEIDLDAADVNGDGAIDNRDVTGASKLASTFIHTHSWGEWTTITEPTEHRSVYALATKERRSRYLLQVTYLRSCLQLYLPV